MDHLALQNQFIAELNPIVVGLGDGRMPSIRRETVLAVLSQSAQHAEDFGELLHEAAYLAASALRLDFFSTAERLTADRLRVAIGSVHDSSNNVDLERHETDADEKRSAYAFALEARHPIVIGPASSEERFRDVRLLERNVQGGIICPISYREQGYGAIGVFSAQPRTFAKDDVMFLHSVALFLGPTRAHQKTERSLAEQSRFLSSSIDALDAMVILLNAEGSILQINRACQTLGGFALSELRGRRLWSAFSRPEEVPIGQAKLAELRTGTAQVKHESFFITKRGETRRVRWTFVKLPEGTSGGAAILATAIDVTEQVKTMQRIAELERETRTTTTIQKAEPASDAPPTPSRPQPSDDPSRERRTHDRRPYPCIQMVAPMLDGRLPDHKSFREVRCFDISPGGFSFLLATKPNFNELIAAFGAPTSRLYLRAKIKHVTPMRHEGRNLLLVGCEYLGRVRLPTPLA